MHRFNKPHRPIVAVVVGLLALLTTLTASLLLPAASQASVAVEQISNDADPVRLATFRTATCRRATRKRAIIKFTATARANGYVLRVDLFRKGRSHDLQYGPDSGAAFSVRGPAGYFSNVHAPPNAPLGGGAIEFNRRGTRMGLGFVPAFNETITSAVSVAGGLTCKYPKKKRRR